MKGRAVVLVRARPGQLDEIADVIGREVGSQVDDERPGGRRDDGLFAGHFGLRERGRKRGGWFWRLAVDNEQQQQHGARQAGHAFIISLRILACLWRPVGPPMHSPEWSRVHETSVRRLPVDVAGDRPSEAQPQAEEARPRDDRQIRDEGLQRSVYSNGVAASEVAARSSKATMALSWMLVT